MPCICQLVIRCFQLNLLIRADGVIYMNMEAVCVIFSVCDTLDGAEAFSVHADKTTGQPFRRCCQQAEVQMCFCGQVIHALSHVPDDIQTKVLCDFAFAVVYAKQCLQCLCQTDKPDGKCAVLEHLSYLVIIIQLFAVNPDTLAHQEGVVVYLFLCLNFKALQQLFYDQVNLSVQLGEEPVDVFVCQNCDTGQVDGGEA